MRVWTVHALERPATAPRKPAAGAAGALAPGELRPDHLGADHLGQDHLGADHIGPGALALVPEGFAWLGFLFGPVWLAWHRLWLPALLVLAVGLALGALLPAGLAVPAELGLQFLVGAHGQDLRRWRLARRGYAEAGVVAARDRDAATARLIDQRPEFAAPLLQAAAP